MARLPPRRTERGRLTDGELAKIELGLNVPLGILNTLPTHISHHADEVPALVDRPVGKAMSEGVAGVALLYAGGFGYSPQDGTDSGTREPSSAIRPQRVIGRKTGP